MLDTDICHDIQTDWPEIPERFQDQAEICAFEDGNWHEIMIPEEMEHWCLPHRRPIVIAEITLKNFGASSNGPGNLPVVLPGVGLTITNLA